MNRIKEMLKIGPVIQYFGRVFIKDKEGKYPINSNLKMMHGINKISILMFLFAVVVMIYRAFTRE